MNLSITNGSSYYPFDIENINYFYVKELNISVVTKGDNVTTILFPSEDSLTVQLNLLVRRFYKQLATIPGIDNQIVVLGLQTGIIYYLNCKNIPLSGGYSLATQFITVNFISGSSHQIICVNSENATDHRDYLINKVISSHLTEWLVGRTQYTVTAGMTRAAIQTVIDSATGGSVVIFQAGTYTDKWFMLKHLVDFVFQDTTFNLSVKPTGNVPMFLAPVTAVTCKLFGNGIFNTTFTTNPLGGWLTLDTNIAGAEGTDIYFEFESCYSAVPTTSAHFHTYAGKLRVSGRACTGVSTRFFDSDSVNNGNYIFDTEVLYVIADNGDTHFYPHNSRTKYYVRNGYYEINSSSVNSNSVMFLADSATGEVNIINSQLVNKNTAADAIIIYTLLSPYIVRLWRVKFVVNNGTEIFSGVDIVNYTNSISNESTTETQTGSGELIIDESLFLFRPFTDEITDNFINDGQIPIINGWGGIRIHAISNITIPYILPTPNQDGLEEFILKESEVTTLEKNNRIVERIDGYRKRFRIHYENLLAGSECLKVASFLENEMDGFKLRLYPRNMNLSYSYEVFSSNTEMMIKILKRGATLGGMQGLTLEFTTIEVFKKIGWMDISNLNTILENQMGMG